MTEIPSTGFAGFDEELRSLLELDQAKPEQTIRDANGDMTKVVAGIPHSAIRAALSLENDDFVKEFSRAHPRQLNPVLTEARRIARKLFGVILDNQEKRSELDELTARRFEDEYYASLNFLSAITTQSEWGVLGDSVRPKVRVNFLGFKDRVIFSSSFDWDDMVYVAYRLVQELREEFDHLKLLTPEAIKGIDLRDEYGDRIPKRISSMTKDLEEIKNKFCSFGMFSKDDFE